tara:strand:- start:5139 stop:5312 length:174 start_codon:yes stop_codon:yes gene_type:complete
MFLPQESCPLEPAENQRSLNLSVSPCGKFVAKAEGSNLTTKADMCLLDVSVIAPIHG